MKKLLLSLFFLVTLGVFAGNAAEELVYTCVFNSSTSKGVSSYTQSWTNTCDGKVWEMVNWNNNNNGWSYVKCGIGATITDAASVPESISTIKITIDAITASSVNGIYLQVSDNTDFSASEKITIGKTTGVKTVSIPSPSPNKYYKITFDTKATKCVQVSKIEYYKAETRPSPELAYAKAEDTYNIGSGDYTAPAIAAKDGFDLSRLTYGSDNEAVATVDETGKVTPVAEGTAVITATFTASDTDEFASEEVSYTLTVTDPRQDNGLAYSAAEYTANINEPFTNPLTNPNSLAVTYSSSDEAVATVNENGEVSPLAVGTAVITATFAGNASFKAGSVSYTLTVVDPNALEETLNTDKVKGNGYNTDVEYSGTYTNYIVRAYNNTTFQMNGGQTASGIAGNSKDGLYRLVSIQVNHFNTEKNLNIYAKDGTYKPSDKSANDSKFSSDPENAGTISKKGGKIEFPANTEYTAFLIKPGAANAVYINDIVTIWKRIKSFAPEFKTTPGSYTGSVEVELTANQEEGVKIYYTTDGTEPSAENGTLYDAPFELTATATVKAIAVEEGMKPSSVIEGKFIVRKPLDENQIFIDFTDNLKKFEKPDIADYPVTEGQDISGVEFISANGGNVTVTASNATYSNGLAASEGTITFKAYWNPITRIEVNGENLSNLIFVTGNAEAANADAETTEAPLTYDNAEGASEVVLNVNGAAKIKDVTVTSKNIQTGIEEIFGEESNAPARWFNLQGMEVNADNLTPGLYIVNRAGKSVKVIVK